MNVCDICLVEWDPQTQNHRRGIDCSAGLKSALDSVAAQVRKLHKMSQESVESLDLKTEALLEAAKKQRDDFAEILDRFDRLAKRVTLLEHPKMERVNAVSSAKNKE